MVTRDILFRHFRPAARRAARGLGRRPTPDAISRCVDRDGTPRRGGARRYPAPELAWLVQHPPLYTAARRRGPPTSCDPDRFQCSRPDAAANTPITDRRSGWCDLMLDLKRRREDVRAFVAALEEWIIQALALLNIVGEIRRERIGWASGSSVAIAHPCPTGASSEDKIAATGVRLHDGQLHGVWLINSIRNLGRFHRNRPLRRRPARRDPASWILSSPASTADLDLALKTLFEDVFEAWSRRLLQLQQLQA